MVSLSHTFSKLHDAQFSFLAICWCYAHKFGSKCIKTIFFHTEWLLCYYALHSIVVDTIIFMCFMAKIIKSDSGALNPFQKLIKRLFWSMNTFSLNKIGLQCSGYRVTLKFLKIKKRTLLLAPEPYLGVAKSIRKRIVKEWLSNQHSRDWINYEWARHSPIQGVQSETVKPEPLQYHESNWSDHKSLWPQKVPFRYRLRGWFQMPLWARGCNRFSHYTWLPKI